MTCQECELRLAQHEFGGGIEEHLGVCPECRAMKAELDANAAALAAMREEELPRGVPFKVPTRSHLYARRALGWVAVAAAITLGLIVPRMWESKPSPPAAAPPTAQVATTPLPPENEARPAPEPKTLTVKMLTSDPRVVVYWLIESKEESE